MLLWKGKNLGRKLIYSMLVRTLVGGLVYDENKKGARVKNLKEFEIS